MPPNRILRASRYSLIVLLALLPVLGYWASQVKFGTSFVEAWLPGDDESREVYKQFRNDFAEDQFLIVSWPDCNLQDPRLRQYSSAIKNLAAESPELTIHEVKSSIELAEGLASAIRGITYRQIFEKLAGFGIGKEGVCFVTISVAQAPIKERAALIASVRQIAKDEIGIAEKDLILAGEPFQVYCIDKASRETMQYYVLPSSLLALSVAWLCLGQLRLTFLVFSISGIGQLLGLALVSYFVREMSAVLVVLPTLIFMLTLSAAVHLTNYFSDAGGTTDKDAGANAVISGASPCFLATLTTVFGFGSLAVSQLVPVWQFGSLAALGLLIASLILLSVFPAVSSLLSSSRLAFLDICRLPSNRLFSFLEGKLSYWTHRFAWPLTLAGVGLLVFSLAGLGRLKTSTEFDDMFPSDSPAVQSLRWVQENIGPITALEYLVTFSSSNTGESLKPDLLSRVGLIRAIEKQLEQSDKVFSTLSAVTYVPELPTSRGAGNTIRRAVLRRKLQANLPELASRGLLSQNDSNETWRISVLIDDLRGDNYQEVREELQSIVDTATTNFADRHSGYSPSTTLTGLRTIVEKAHFALLTDLGGSFVTAFLLITPVMMLIVRGVFSGALLMIPNVLPVAVVFGGMGWLEIQLDVASILTASVALGIAVDDTLHFVTWYLRSRRKQKDPAASVAVALGKCTKPMLNTTAICAGSMLPFFFSDFLPTSKFATLMILILSGAILGDLILLPAMLQTRLGLIIGGRITDPDSLGTAPDCADDESSTPPAQPTGQTMPTTEK